MRYTIRLGICACTTFYHGAFEGLRLKLPGLPGVYGIVEVTIPEGRGRGEMSQEEALKKARCHYFLDVHVVAASSPARYDTTLILCELVPNGEGRKEKLYRVCVPGRRYIRRFVEWQDRAHPPSREEIRQAAQKLAREMREARRPVWLQRMTPSGWELS